MKIIIQNNQTKEVLTLTLREVLEEINRDRSSEWTEYNETDWQEGIEVFTEYRLLYVRTKQGVSQ